MPSFASHVTDSPPKPTFLTNGGDESDGDEIGGNKMDAAPCTKPKQWRPGTPLVQQGSSVLTTKGFSAVDHSHHRRFPTGLASDDGSGEGHRDKSGSRPMSMLSGMSRTSSLGSLDMSLFGDEDVDTTSGQQMVLSHSNFDMDLPKPRGINPLDFMSCVTNQAQVLETGLRELRYEMSSDPVKTAVDLGTEAVVLSGLNRKCQRSMGHIQRLYDETKYLKAYLDKMEAKVHYDLETVYKKPHSPGMLRRITFLTCLGLLFGYFYAQKWPLDFEMKTNKALIMATKLKDAILANGQHYSQAVYTLVRE